jgi:hypothetical protein
MFKNNFGMQTASSQTISCQRAELYIASFLDGRLGDVRRDELARHALTCPDCEQLLLASYAERQLFVRASATIGRCALLDVLGRRAGVGGAGPSGLEPGAFAGVETGVFAGVEIVCVDTSVEFVGGEVVDWLERHGGNRLGRHGGNGSNGGNGADVDSDGWCKPEARKPIAAS